MLIKEYRICIPVSVDEYKTAQTYTIAKFSTQETKAGDGVRIDKTEEFDDHRGKGVYTEKTFFIESKIPAWIKYMFPAGSLIVYEKATNAFPYTKNTYETPIMGERFSMTIETKHINNRGEEENVFGLPEEVLKTREVVHVDILKDEQTWFVDETLPPIHEYKSEKTGRGPLIDGWRQSFDPVMCSYKLVSLEFRVWGLQTKVESYAHWAMQQIFLGNHKKAFCWIDEWYGLTAEELKEFEAKAKEQLQEQLRATAAAQGQN